ncbi:hypothetical protein [Sulfitobacter sp. M22]|uniref:hypothetical protein n=1 Tax=Sulfitobacter sp. M22 TaxID=2675332 RepID=UPI001F224904|nr:hypothetical protein [Sulfitobacter sp. M22]MCF7728684.1 hypothetical protein [Sulfitobacter sp. M22]
MKKVMTKRQQDRLMKAQVKSVTKALKDPVKTAQAAVIACEVAVRLSDRQALADYIETETSSPIYLMNVYVKSLDDVSARKVAVRGPLALEQHVTGRKIMTDVEPFDPARNYLLEQHDEAQRVLAESRRLLAEVDATPFSTATRAVEFDDEMDTNFEVEQPDSDGYYSPLSLS